MVAAISMESAKVSLKVISGYWLVAKTASKHFICSCVKVVRLRRGMPRPGTRGGSAKTRKLDVAGMVLASDTGAKRHKQNKQG